MSLVGSLEDLGLGDILQIVSLSRKSGLLSIHSEENEGRMVFCDGLVRAAYVKGEPEDLRTLLVNSNFLAADEFQRADELANARGVAIDEVIPENTSLSLERLDALRREHVEKVVFRIFSWKGGEFNFEMRDQIDARDREILMPTGINAQFLTMEATRLGDEGERSEAESQSLEAEASISENHDDQMFSGETEQDSFETSASEDAWAQPQAPDVEPEAVESEAVEAIAAVEVDSAEPAVVEPEAVEAIAAAEVDTAEPAVVEPEAIAPEAAESAVVAAESEAADPLDGPCEPHEILALATTQREVPEIEQEFPSAVEPEETPAALEPQPQAAAKPQAPAPAEPRSSTRVPSCLIAIDPKLSTLEWQKEVLADLFPRVHIFQSCESGIARIRQYLGRGETPVVLVSVDLQSEATSADDGLAAFIKRLKTLAPFMLVLIVEYESAQSALPGEIADAVIAGPDPMYLINPSVWEEQGEVAKQFRADVGCWSKGSIEPSPTAAPKVRPEASPAAESMQRLRELSAQMRDPEMSGDVMSLVLDFAAESHSRVAMFMLRDETAIGMAQRGLAGGGGPSDDEFRKIELPAWDIAWFRRVLETGNPARSAPEGDGDQELALRLGGEAPTEAYVAPIASGGQIVALLYTDNLPSADPVGDTTVLEFAIHEAGFALERALLERARKGEAS